MHSREHPAPPDPLADALAGALTLRCGVRPGDRVLVAVSGGADSVCLLHLLQECRARRGFPDLHVAHLDHSVRGAAGRRAAAAVRRLCRSRGVPCTVEALPPWPGPPSEDGLRRARHAFLERVADAVGADWIALAHHRRDQAETVLWNLARGSGRRGLGGMRPVSGRRIRPLLDIDPQELRSWLRRRRLRWLEDETNRSPLYTRNRVRALIPLLERRVHPAARRNLARAADILASEDELLDSLAGRRLRGPLARRKDALALDAGSLQAEHPALRRRILRLAVRLMSGGALSLSLARTERLEALAAAGRGGIDLGGGIRAERAGRALVLRRLEALPAGGTGRRGAAVPRREAGAPQPGAGVAQRETGAPQREVGAPPPGAGAPRRSRPARRGLT